MGEEREDGGVGLPVPPVCIAEGEGEGGRGKEVGGGAEEVGEALVEEGELGEDVDVGDEGPVFLGEVSRLGG